MHESPVRVSPIVHSQGNKNLTIPVKIHRGNEDIKVSALVDSGAEGEFIHHKVIEKYQIPARRLAKPIKIQNVDGSPNKAGNITHDATCTVDIDGQQSRERFLVTDTGKTDAILGLPWLQRQNPTIDWQKGTVQLSDDPSIQALRIAAKTSTSAELAQQSRTEKDATPIEDRIPVEFHEFLPLFNGEIASQFPPKRDCDHKIEFKRGFAPKKARIYPMTLEEDKALKAFIQENLAKGFIQPSKSPQASACFFVGKKDGSKRLCQDYRYVNEWTVKNSYPLPLSIDAPDSLKGARFFTIFDIQSGYNNIQIALKDRWKAAFVTKYGLFEPTVMFFGLCNSPATFQAFMDDIFREEIAKGEVIIYMDDMLIPGRTKEELRERTNAILRKLRDNHLCLKATKCKFEQTEVEYLGMIISHDRIAMDPTKLSGIRDWPTPTRVKHVQQFLGFANFYRRFIPGYANITKPLDRLKVKNKAWDWTSECQEAFTRLKAEFQKRHTLLIPDKRKPFVLETDASKVASGAILLQHDDNGELKPCGFLSKAFNPTEQRYEIYDRELLAIIRGLQAFRHYLEGSPHIVLIRCDHKNLTFFRHAQRLRPRQFRWHLELSMYNIKITHTPGKKMAMADALSRWSSYGEGEEDPKMVLLPDSMFEESLETDNIATVEINALSDPDTEESDKSQDEDEPLIDLDVIKEQLRTLTLNDPDCQFIKQAIAKQSLPPFKTALSDWEERDGMLFHKNRIYVPANLELKREIVKVHHVPRIMGHPGARKTFVLTRRTFWWPGMSYFVNEYVRGCAYCQQAKANTHPNVPPLIPIDADPRATPFSTITMDFITGLPESQGHDALLVIVDHDCTKGIILAPCKTTIGAIGTARLIFEHVVRRFGLPKRIISDRGPQFASRTFKALFAKVGVKTSLSTAYHPQTDGQTERANQEIETYLRIYCSRQPEKWADHLTEIEFCHNNREQSAIKESPFYVMMGYHPTTWPDDRDRDDHIPSVSERITALSDIRSEASAALELARNQMAERSRAHYQAFEVDELVWLDSRNIATLDSPKFKQKRLGPFRVAKRHGKINYELELPDDWSIHPVFHASLLSKAHTTQAHGESHSKPPPETIDNEEEWEVEAILNKRRRSGKDEYLVAWKGYPDTENEWVQEEDLEHAQDVLSEYKRKHPTSRKKKRRTRS